MAARFWQGAAAPLASPVVLAMLVKVINQHDVAGYRAILRIEEPAAIGRDRQAVPKPLSTSKIGRICLLAKSKYRTDPGASAGTK
jgi:hypothetical protein